MDDEDITADIWATAVAIERERWFDVLRADAKAFVESPLSDECDRQAFTLLAHCVLDKMKPGWRAIRRGTPHV